MKRLIALLIACAATAACEKRDPVARGAENTAGLPTMNEAAPSAAGERRGGTETAAGEAVPAATIPAALHGRWGLTPADCSSTRGDAKGLLTVTAGELRFYESRAVPTAHAVASPDSISGDFAFTGEGQSWTKYLVLQLQKQELVRTESNPTASFTYAKCS